MIATKAFNVAKAAKGSVSLLGPGMVVQTIQNRSGLSKVAAPTLVRDCIAVGVVGGFRASVRPPDHDHVSA